MTWSINVPENFGASNIMYNGQKEKAIAERLKQNHDYTNEDIAMIFEQYDIKKNPEGLEKLEDDIIKAEDNAKYIKKANEELVV